MRDPQPLLKLYLAVVPFVLCATVSATTTYGTLNNFDVFNDTGQIARGFDIELTGISAADISYTFHSPDIRYAAPAITNFPGGVHVRYESRYNPVTKSWLEGTAVAINPSPTGGHQCWTGGAGANYDASGCEHFGLGYTGSPTNTTYTWLVEDSSTPGTLKAFGSNVSMAAPVWQVTPPAVPAAQPVVHAIIHAPDPVVYEFGDALWVKVFVTEQHDRAELNDLVSGSPAVPDEPAETEIEWFLLQASINGNKNEELEAGGEVGQGHESVIRRYEYYKYAGRYDPENHEALNETPDANSVGAYIGAQMAAVNLQGNAPAVPEPATAALMGMGLAALASLRVLLRHRSRG